MVGMAQRQQQRATPAPATSQTTTETTRAGGAAQAAPRILRLRGRHNSSGNSVQWADDVVDNEGLGRKKSKVCCIYHKPKAVGESSDESSSDSSSSDSDSEADRAKPARSSKDQDHDCGHDHDHSHGRRRRPGKKQKRPPSPNAYEKVPKQRSQGNDDGKGAENKGPGNNRS